MSFYTPPPERFTSNVYERGRVVWSWEDQPLADQGIVGKAVEPVIRQGPG